MCWCGTLWGAILMRDVSKSRLKVFETINSNTRSSKGYKRQRFVHFWIFRIFFFFKKKKTLKIGKDLPGLLKWYNISRISTLYAAPPHQGKSKTFFLQKLIQHFQYYDTLSFFSFFFFTDRLASLFAMLAWLTSRFFRV